VTSREYATTSRTSQDIADLFAGSHDMQGAMELFAKVQVQSVQAFWTV